MPRSQNCHSAVRGTGEVAKAVGAWSDTSASFQEISYRMEPPVCLGLKMQLALRRKRAR